MKVTYTNIVENHMAWRAKNYCAKCGAHEYNIIEQIVPNVDRKWYVQCPQCGYETEPSYLKDIALLRWLRLPEGD